MFDMKKIKWNRSKERKKDGERMDGFSFIIIIIIIIIIISSHSGAYASKHRDKDLYPIVLVIYTHINTI